MSSSAMPLQTTPKTRRKRINFYQHLQTVLDRVGKKDMTILMGDFHAKIGRDNTGYEEVMGKQGLGEMKENGEKFADLCSLNQLVIGGSIFPHKRTHKATWRSPDHVTENQIDHACTVEPRFNEVAGDRPNLFVKWRVRYIEVLFPYILL